MKVYTFDPPGTYSPWTRAIQLDDHNPKDIAFAILFVCDGFTDWAFERERFSRTRLIGVTTSAEKQMAKAIARRLKKVYRSFNAFDFPRNEPQYAWGKILWNETSLRLAFDLTAVLT